MVYHLQVISATTNKNTKSRYINIEIDDDYQNLEDLESKIDQKFHKKLSDLQSITKNEYIYNKREENKEISDYVIRIEERNLN